MPDNTSLDPLNLKAVGELTDEHIEILAQLLVDLDAGDEAAKESAAK